MTTTVLDRLLKELAAQDGTDPEADELTDAQWSKVNAHPHADYGSPVTILWCGDMEGIEDHGYLTTLPTVEDEWDMAGIVHIPEAWCEKAAPEQEWHSLYSLCRNEMVKEIVIEPGL
jgi:hypothetical protein